LAGTVQCASSAAARFFPQGTAFSFDWPDVLLGSRCLSAESLQCCFDHRRKQKENQEDLLKRVNEETLRVLRHNQDENNQGGSGGGRQVSEVVAYRSISDMPSTRDLAIQVCLGFLQVHLVAWFP